ncbi:MAG: histidine kinase [Bacteroidota bacterium]
MLNGIQHINDRLYVLLHIGAWLIVAIFSIAVFLTIYPLDMSVGRALGNLLPLAFLFYVNRYLVDWLYEQKRYVLFVLLNLALVFALIPVRIRFNMLFPNIPLTPGLDIDARLRWGMASFVTNLMINGLGIFYYILKNRYRVERQNQEEISRQNEAQLQFLRAQINPHFLFNTLNNIYSLAVIQSEKTADMVLQLSQLLRYVVYDGKADLVALDREIAHIQSYINLFQMRSEASLNIMFHVSGTTAGQQIEPMILIPLVENCFKHCDFAINPNAFINLQLQVQSDQLDFYTQNTRTLQDQQKDKVGGIGLDNIQTRLALKYPNQHHLQITPSEHQFEVALTLQLIRDAKN